MKNNSAKDYDLSECIEAGMILTGPQTKSIALNKANINGARCQMAGDKFLLLGITFDSTVSEVPLLLHKRELRWIKDKVAAGRWTVPVRIYTKNKKFKLEVGVGMKLKKHDKREKEKSKVARKEATDY